MSRTPDNGRPSARARPRGFSADGIGTVEQQSPAIPVQPCCSYGCAPARVVPVMETAQSREYFGGRHRKRAGHAKLNAASVRDKRTAGLGERTKRLVAGDGAENP